MLERKIPKHIKQLFTTFLKIKSSHNRVSLAFKVIDENVPKLSIGRSDYYLQFLINLAIKKPHIKILYITHEKSNNRLPKNLVLTSNKNWIEFVRGVNYKYILVHPLFYKQLDNYDLDILKKLKVFGA